MKKIVFLISIMGLLWASCQQNQELIPYQLIPYRKGDKWGFCTPDKKMVVQPKYDDAWSFSEGLAWVKLNGKWGFIDTTGKEIVTPKYDDASSFHEGLAGVKLNGKVGFIDKTGKEIVTPKYDYALYFSEGLAGVKLNGKYFYIKIFPDSKVVEYYEE